MYVKWRIIDDLHNADLSANVVGRGTLYKIKKECYLLRSCLVDAGRILLFMVEQVFLTMGEAWSMHIYNVQCEWGERRPKGREEFLCLNFSCLAIKYEFYFTRMCS